MQSEDSAEKRQQERDATRALRDLRVLWLLALATSVPAVVGVVAVHLGTRHARYYRPRSGEASKCRSAGTGPVVSDRKSTRLNSSHTVISYAVFCLKKKKINVLEDRF